MRQAIVLSLCFILFGIGATSARASAIACNEFTVNTASYSPFLDSSCLFSLSGPGTNITGKPAVGNDDFLNSPTGSGWLAIDYTENVEPWEAFPGAVSGIGAGATSGTFTIGQVGNPLASIYNHYASLALGFKASTNVGVFLLPVGNLMGDWTSEHGVSHIVLYGKGEGTTSTPEPASLLLFGSGMVAIGALFRKRKA